MLTHQAARVTPPPAMPRKLRIEYPGAIYNDLNRATGAQARLQLLIPSFAALA